MPRTYTYKTTSGCEVKADVFGQEGAGPYPVVVWIHGGALVAGNRTQVRLRRGVLEGYLASGLVVVSIDYRLSPETKLPGILEDLRDAFAWVRSEGPGLFAADPSRIAAVGHSAGGYLALMAGVCVRPRPVVIASVYGYGDIAGEWYSRPDPFYCRQPPVSEADAAAAVEEGEVSDLSFTEARQALYLHYRQQGTWPREVAGVDPDTDAAAFDAWCPDRNVDADFPPTHLIHGTADTDVPHHLSATMADRLAVAGVDHEFITLDGAPHGFDMDPAWRDNAVVAEAFEKQREFLLRYL